MSRATRLRPTRCPSSCSSAWIRGDPVGLPRILVHFPDPRRERRVRLGTRRRLAPAPSVIARPRHLEHPAHRLHRIDGLVRPHESEGLGNVIDSRANQAAAFPRISRSSSSCLTFRRSCRSSVRSSLVSPSARNPSSWSSCSTHFRIVFAVDSNSRANSSGVRPRPGPARPSAARTPARTVYDPSSSTCVDTSVPAVWMCPRNRVNFKQIITALRRG